MLVIPILLFLSFCILWAVTFVHLSRSNTVSKYITTIVQWLKSLDQATTVNDDAQSFHTLNDLQKQIINSSIELRDKMNWHKQYALKMGIPLLILPTAIGCSLLIYIGDYQPAFSIPAAIFIGLGFLIVGICVIVYMFKSYQNQAALPQFLTQNKFLDMSKVIHTLRVKIVAEIILWELLLVVYLTILEVNFYLVG